ncbi:MAG TPA: LysR substrate-binding domain-containing protein [Kineosporiaceae bacterium]
MELRHLRYFVMVAQELHFGRAAARLHMAQPPLSQQIRRLEEDLGVTLLDRTTRRVELTPAGVAYLARAQEILAAVDGAAREARQVEAGLVGRLAIGCVGSATYTLLPALARCLRERLRGVDVSFRGEMLVPDQIAALADGSLDLALLRPPDGGSGDAVLAAADRPRTVPPGAALRIVPLRQDRLVVALPDGLPLAGWERVEVGDLRGEDFVVHPARGRSVMHDIVVGLCRAAGFVPRIRHEVAETSTMITFVAAGLGVALVPEPVTVLGVPGVAYRPLVAEAAQVPLAAATRATDDAPLLARALDIVRALAT